MSLSLIDLVFPSSCIVCDSKPKQLCSECAPVAAYQKLELFDIPVLTAFEFDGAIAKLISGYKDQQLTALEKTLASYAAELFRSQNFNSVAAVIVPARNQKNFRKRGFDPALRIAKAGLRLAGLPIKVVSLSSTRQRVDQRGLGRIDRASNLSGSMRLKASINGPVAIFDDVLTTGATLKEMIRACEAAGGQVSFGCVLAQRFSSF